MKQTFVVLATVALIAVLFFSRQKEQNVDHSADPQPPPQAVVDGTTQKAPNRNVASASAPLATVAKVTAVPVETKERALLVDLIKTTRAAENKSDLRVRVRELRAKFNALPNKKQVLWDYYRDLQGANSAHFERVEALDMLNGRGGDKQLAEVALAESLDYAPAATVTMDNARTEQERNIASTTDQSYIPVIVAYEIYLNNCGSYAGCQQGLLTVIANNPNHNMRASLIEAVNKRFPQSKQEFAADLARYQLN
ncbi:hypothetical protein [Bdellovibrio sp. KM01]|uniref:hypothetical protein n=1 Tax=Bdellovibrio sp. KM01 TaxID=2748865 RepID=UPI0015E9BFC8|nr:hypothetical protein [Bdellovibrio sp. KM01]QLY25212.1 hypothetical protein HW988_17630 [Bdellovibrio sp. KM01]